MCTYHSLRSSKSILLTFFTLSATHGPLHGSSSSCWKSREAFANIRFQVSYKSPDNCLSVRESVDKLGRLSAVYGVQSLFWISGSCLIMTEHMQSARTLSKAATTFFEIRSVLSCLLIFNCMRTLKLWRKAHQTSRPQSSSHLRHMSSSAHQHLPTCQAQHRPSSP